jgi:hypothetical protein
MPSAGSQVLLQDGSPLYGPGEPPELLADDATDGFGHRRGRQRVVDQQLEAALRRRRRGQPGRRRHPHLVGVAAPRSP